MQFHFKKKKVNSAHPKSNVLYAATELPQRSNCGRNRKAQFLAFKLGQAILKSPQLFWVGLLLLFATKVNACEKLEVSVPAGDHLLAQWPEDVGQLTVQPLQHARDLFDYHVVVLELQLLHLQLVL